MLAAHSVHGLGVLRQKFRDLLVHLLEASGGFLSPCARRGARLDPFQRSLAAIGIELHKPRADCILGVCALAVGTRRQDSLQRCLQQGRRRHAYTRRHGLRHPRHHLHLPVAECTLPCALSAVLRMPCGRVAGTGTERVRGRVTLRRARRHALDIPLIPSPFFPPCSTHWYNVNGRRHVHGRKPSMHPTSTVNDAIHPRAPVGPSRASVGLDYGVEILKTMLLLSRANCLRGRRQGRLPERRARRRQVRQLALLHDPPIFPPATKYHTTAGTRQYTHRHRTLLSVV